jgi:hypothetical protein
MEPQLNAVLPWNDSVRREIDIFAGAIDYNIRFLDGGAGFGLENIELNVQYIG